MNEHTPETLHVIEDDEGYFCLHSRRDPNAGDLGEFLGAIDFEETAQRIKACWDACAGIPTEQLEDADFQKLIGTATNLANDVTEKLVAREACHDPWAECPLQDAHKGWSTAAMLEALRVALAPFRKD